MPTFKVTYFSSGGYDIPALSAAVASLQREGREIEIYARTHSQLFDQARQKEFAKRALNSQAVVLSLHGGRDYFPAFKALKTSLDSLDPAETRPLIHAQPASGDAESLSAALELNPEPGSIWEECRPYLAHGGRDNWRSFLARLHDHLEPQEPWGFLEPRKQPFDGIYHPDFSGPVELDEYLAKKVVPGRVTVGLWFYSVYWVNDNLEFVDAMIRAIEAEGANVLPLFHSRYRDVELNNPGSGFVVDKFFLDAKGHKRIDVLLDLMGMSMNLMDETYKPILPKLGVPVIQGICSYVSRATWEEGWQGLSTMEVTHSAAMPEFDGKLITVPVAFREENKVDPITHGLISSLVPDLERTKKLARLTINWGRLGRTPTKERKIAIIFHHYPPRNDRIGCAAGLDSFASVSQMLSVLKDEGYQVADTFPEKDSLAKTIISKLTSDQRWLTPEQMAARAEAEAGPELYGPWSLELPEKNRADQKELWGDLPGDLFVHDRKMFFAGFPNGRVFVTIQPTRGAFESVEKQYHDLRIPPPHQYPAHYRWLRDVWGAQAVIHVGKHGSLEWLPGKALGLSRECWPDLAIMELPNIYPYIINDPGEGTQAKRRSYCCLVDHLTPASTNADLYDDLAKIEILVAEYRQAELGDPSKLPTLRQSIWEATVASYLDKDLETAEPSPEEFEEFLAKLHAYVHELSDSMIADGLHILGLAPEGDRLSEFVVQLTRLKNGSIPSLRETLVKIAGFDYEVVLANRGRVLAEFGGLSGGQIIAQAHEKALALVKELAVEAYKPEKAPEIILKVLGRPEPLIEEVLTWVGAELVPNIRLCTEELGAISTSLASGYVRPGPSGAPSRGQADILPTGRNFYSVDPRKVPSPAAWKIGVALGDALIERALRDTGHYPENVGIIVYGTSTMRTQGDDIAEILYLLGLKPVWRPDGVVEGLEVIPLAELKRPRIDVTPRISGFFRDSFPNLVERLDEAVRMVALLNEPVESNYVKRHVEVDLAIYLNEGKSEEEAFREATFRVFGCPPGTYGAGVEELVESKKWQTQDDLANAYIRYSAHAYGQGSYGLVRPEVFRRNLARMDVTVKNEDSREYDLLSCTDYYNYYGGLITAAKSVRGTYPLSIVGDSSDPERVKTRSVFEESKRVLRSRLVNPKWLNGLKRHGYKGAGDISHMMDVILGWDATAEIIDDWMYEKAAKAWALDPEMARWLKEVNPYALQNILDKLLEAIKRGMWSTTQDMENQLREAYLELEGQLEELNDDAPQDTSFELLKSKAI
ncbi:MAG: cobaltochelatase subunit CobN [Deltaproteobacteria bacterium]|jgi:cobaltochelatase CobN|nr:cobaltochelatase subunit CobN [Deltaproteobacteria bacterium]